jgi:hypothetical protein
MWVKGQPWRVVNGLDVLRNQLRAFAPASVPPATPATSWGAVADDEHSSASGHYPHYYGVLGAVAVVCARDFPHAPALGLHIGEVFEAIRLSRDPRVAFLIFNREITGPNHGWRWEEYFGDDPHDTHGHVESVHTSIADGVAPWQITIPAPSVPARGDDVEKLVKAADNSAIFYVTNGARWQVPSVSTFNDMKAAGIGYLEFDTAAVMNSWMDAVAPPAPAAAKK